MDLTAITAKADAYCHSYAKAVAAGVTDPSLTPAQVAERIFDHYQPEGFVSFAFGTMTKFGDKEAMMPSMTAYMQQWIDYKLGLDIRMDKYKIRAVSTNHALCYITWSIHPPADSGIGGWNWENVYSFRVPIGQETGFWDFTICDNETGGLMSRFPRFMDTIGQ